MENYVLKYCLHEFVYLNENLKISQQKYFYIKLFT